MMFSPKQYIEPLLEEPLEVLIEERERLMEEICCYEKKYFKYRNTDKEYLIDQEKEGDCIFMILPSPTTRYSVQLDYLVELTELIKKRFYEEKHD